MRKLFSLFVAAAFALSCAAVAMAADEKAAPAAEKKAAAPAEKKAEKKAKAQFVTGTIEAVDAAAGTLTVKGRKGPVELKAGEKVKLDGFSKGDKVTVKYSEGTALAVMKPKAKKEGEMKTEGAKKEMAPAPSAEKK